MQSSTPRSVLRKLVHLQILRAVAASLVVVDHAFGALEFRGVSCSQYLKPGELLGHLGVSAFFVLSGLIMVRSSSERFGGGAGNPIRFAWHRIVRIIPMYWLATLTLFAGSRIVGRALIAPWSQLLRSLFFIPNHWAHDIRMAPLLEPGWTLNYEMSFYLLFSLALFFPRRLGILILLVVPELLVALGRAHTFPTGSVSGFYTDALILIMAYGVMIGFIETELQGLPRIQWRISPAFLLLIPAVLILASPRTLGRINAWDLLSLFSVLVVLACTLTADEQFGWFGRTMVLLGDASFSTYLFHIFLYPTLFTAFVKLATFVHTTAQRPLLFATFAVVVANTVGLLIHLCIERPLTNRLRRIRFWPATQLVHEP